MLLGVIVAVSLVDLAPGYAGLPADKRADAITNCQRAQEVHNRRQRRGLLYLKPVMMAAAVTAFYCVQLGDQGSRTEKQQQCEAKERIQTIKDRRLLSRVARLEI